MKRHRWIQVLLLLALPLPAHAGFERLVLGGLHAGLAGATVAWEGDPAGPLNNPAAMAGLSRFTLSASASPALFGVPGLQPVATCVACPLPWGTAGASVSTVGVSGYRETALGLSFAFAPGATWDAGVRVNALLLSIAGYGSTALPTCDAGVQVRVTESLTFGLLMTNVTGMSLGEENEALPRAIECGFSFTSTEHNIVLCASAAQELLSPVDCRIGIAYAPYKCLEIRTGVCTDPALLCAGIGLALGPVSVDYAATHHWQLGLTHHVSVWLPLG